MTKDQNEPLTSQCLSDCSKALAFQQRAAFSTCLLLHPRKPFSEHGMNACSILQPLWSYLWIAQCSPMEDFIKERMFRCSIEDLQVWSARRTKVRSYQYREIKDMEPDGDQEDSIQQGKKPKKATRRKPERDSQNSAEPHESDRASPLLNGLTWRECEAEKVTEMYKIDGQKNRLPC